MIKVCSFVNKDALYAVDFRLPAKFTNIVLRKRLFMN